jgi:hypothetical protein
LSNKRFCPAKANTSEKNPGKLAKPTDCLLAAPGPPLSNPSDAREALENGSMAGIGPYLRDDVAPLLRLIAERRHRTSQRTTKPPAGYDPDLEFEFDTADVAWAIEGGRSELVDDYLRELGKLMIVLGDMLDSEGGPSISSSPFAAEGESRKITSEIFSRAKSIRT